MQEKRSEMKRNNRKFWILYFSYFAGATFVLEILLNFFNFDFWIRLLTSLVGLILTTVLSNIFGLGKKANPEAKPKTTAKAANKVYKNDLEKATHYIRSETNNIWRRAIAVAGPLFLVFLLLVMPAYAAHFHMFGRGFKLVIKFVDNMITSIDSPIDGNSDSPLESSVDSSEESPGEESSEDIPLEESSVSPNDSFLKDPYRNYQLSDNDINRLFFLEGRYSVLDWTDIEAIKFEVQFYILDLCDQKLPNSFDESAPQDVRQDIVFASALESQMEDSDDLDRIIMLRESAWNNGYRKATIAFLLGNNMQTYAQKYCDINGNYDTIKYYYAYSIFWHFDLLTFDETKNRKDVLRYISMRYHDLAAIAPSNSVDYWRATQLHKAFSEMANESF